MKESAFFKNREAILENIEVALRYTIDKQNKNIQYILTAPPDLLPLLENIKALNAKYFAYTYKHKLSLYSADVQLQKFMMLVMKHCHELYPIYNHPNDLTDQQRLELDRVCNLLRGLILFVSSNTTKGSLLHKECLQVLSMTDNNQVSIENQTTWLDALLCYLKSLPQHSPETLLEWKNNHFIKFEDYQLLLHKQVADAHVNYVKKPLSQDYLNRIISYGLQCGLGIAITQATVDATLPTAASMTIGTAALTGPIGMVMIGTAGVIGSQLFHLVNNKVIPAALANFYGKFFTTLGNMIGNGTTSMITITYEALRDKTDSLHDFFKLIASKDEECLNDLEWMTKLLDLPDKVFEETNKSLIKKNRYVGSYY